MNPFGPFLRLFRFVGWPPPENFLQGLAPVLVWHALGGLVPDASDAMRLSWAVFAFLTVLIWKRCRVAIERARKGRLNPVTVACVLFGNWVVFATFIYLTQEFAWAPHWITGVFAFQAFVYLIEILFKADSLEGTKWGEEPARPTLTVAQTFFYAGLALFNETLVGHLSIEAWIIWLGVLPLVVWVFARALTFTVLLSLEEESD